MHKHKTGEIVLTPFPFTDLSGNKVRPALILGVQLGSDDVTVCFISSNLPSKTQKSDVVIDPVNNSFKQTGLKLKSVIKIAKIATLDKAVILGKIGELGKKDLALVKTALKNHLGL